MDILMSVGKYAYGAIEHGYGLICLLNSSHRNKTKPSASVCHPVVNHLTYQKISHDLNQTYNLTSMKVAQDGTSVIYLLSLEYVVKNRIRQ